MSIHRLVLNRDLIVTTFLELLEMCTYPESPNFRALARELNCAHQSLYRYFPSYGALQTEARLRLMVYLKETLHYRETILDFSAQVIDSALTHPNWYLFLWTYQSESNIPEVMKAIFAQRPRPELIALEPFLRLDGQEFTHQNAVEFLQIAHSMLHGELVKFLCGRHHLTDVQSFKTAVLQNLETLFTWAQESNRQLI